MRKLFKYIFIQSILSCLLCVFYLGYKGIIPVNTKAMANDVNLSSEEKIEEISNEVSNKKPSIYIDAGHGCRINGIDLNATFGWTTEGAVGEADYTKMFSAKLIDALKSQTDYDIYEIDDMELYGIKGSRELFGNSARRDSFNESDCDILIQIHYDDDTSKTISGGHIIYNSNIKNSYLLSKCILEKMEKYKCRINYDYYENGLSDRNDIAMLSYNKGEKPIILLELGFGAKADYDYLRDENVQNTLIRCVVEGCEDYFDKVETKENMGKRVISE